MTVEGFPFWGKRAERFLGVSRWTLRRYQRAGLLPEDRRHFSEAELLACVASLKRTRRPGAAERINVPRAKKTSKAAGAQQATPPTPETPKVAETPASAEPVAPSPAPPPEPREAGGAGAQPDERLTGRAPIPSSCSGASDPHHVEFPKGKAWPKSAEEKATEKAASEPAEPSWWDRLWQGEDLSA